MIVEGKLSDISCQLLARNSHGGAGRELYQKSKGKYQKCGVAGGDGEFIYVPRGAGGWFGVWAKRRNRVIRRTPCYHKGLGWLKEPPVVLARPLAATKRIRKKSYFARGSAP